MVVIVLNAARSLKMESSGVGCAVGFSDEFCPSSSPVLPNPSTLWINFSKSAIEDYELWMKIKHVTGLQSELPFHNA